MALITLPAGVASVSWTRPPRSAWTSRSGYTGKQTVIDRGGVTQGWRAAVTVAPSANMRAWNLWQAAMLGPVNTVRLLAARKEQVASATLGNISVVTSSSQVSINGLPLSVTGYIKAGSPVTVYLGAGPDTPRLVTVMADMNTNGSGVGVLTFQPPLAGLVVGRKVELQFPFCEMRLADAGSLGFDEQAGGIYRASGFSLEEVV